MANKQKLPCWTPGIQILSYARECPRGLFELMEWNGKAPIPPPLIRTLISYGRKDQRRQRTELARHDGGEGLFMVTAFIQLEVTVPIRAHQTSTCMSAGARTTNLPSRPLNVPRTHR